MPNSTEVQGSTNQQWFAVTDRYADAIHRWQHGDPSAMELARNAYEELRTIEAPLHLSMNDMTGTPVLKMRASN
jgi:hypothetical protein